MYGRARSQMSLYKLTITDQTIGGHTEKETYRGTSFRSAQKLHRMKTRKIKLMGFNTIEIIQDSIYLQQVTFQHHHIIQNIVLSP